MRRAFQSRRHCPNGNTVCIFPPLTGVDCRSHATSTRQVAIGEVVASLAPTRMKTLLGSCVTVCLHDPLLKAGGMNHILVPASCGDGKSVARFGVQAMELLINALMKLGADRRRLVAKAFGGANVLPVFSTPTIGELNAEFVRQFLHDEGIPLLAEWMGGDLPMEVIFETGSGRVRARTVAVSRLPMLVREEASWCDGATRLFASEEPTIF